MAISETWANTALDTLMEVTAYAALFVGDPEDAGTEVSGSNYARVQVTTATWDAASGKSKDNGAVITFPEASGSWGTVDYVALYDASTAGNRLCSFELTSPVEVGTNDIPRFSAAAFEVSAA
jgi:hypothetical protein